MNRLGKIVSPFIFAALLATGLYCAAEDRAAEDPPPRWKLDANFQRALASEFNVVNWPRGSSLRDGLQRLGRLRQVAIFLDRRIDPDQPVELIAKQVTLEELIGLLAAQGGAMPVQIGAVVYVGPRDAVAGLSAVAQRRARESRALPNHRSSALAMRRGWRWNALAEPRQLIAELAADAKVKLDGLDAIPHDLWPAVDLPPSSWTDRMTIVLAGFNLTFEFTDRGRGVRLVPLPPQRLVKRVYSATLPQMHWERIARQFPNADVDRSSNQISLQGTPEEHERLRSLLAQQPATQRQRRPRQRKVHSLRVSEQPIGAILKTLEQQLQLRLEYASGVQDKLHTRVSFDLNEVPLDRLLDATLAPAALTFQRKGDVVRISIKQ